MSNIDSRRYLLLQVRNQGDPMRRQEVACFAWALGCSESQLTPHDLLATAPSRSTLSRHDLVFIGGSGDYSAAGGGDWLERTLEALREIYEAGVPMFASCWGFQAMCRALGGRCVNDPAHAELGPTEMKLTPAGKSDPVFGQLPETFAAHSGHEDRVDLLPPEAELLASSSLVPQQAVRFVGKPIYATQFHPELSADAFFQRVANYPKYVEQIAGVTVEEFRHRCRETPEANSLLRRFAAWACD